MEFLADEGHANAPFWLMQHLELAEVIHFPSPPHHQTQKQ